MRRVRTAAGTLEQRRVHRRAGRPINRILGPAERRLHADDQVLLLHVDDFLELLRTQPAAAVLAPRQLDALEVHFAQVTRRQPAHVAARNRSE